MSLIVAFIGNVCVFQEKARVYEGARFVIECKTYLSLRMYWIWKILIQMSRVLAGSNKTSLPGAHGEHHKRKRRTAEDKK